MYSEFTRDKVLGSLLSWERLVDEVIWIFEELLVFGEMILLTGKELIYLHKI